MRVYENTQKTDKANINGEPDTLRGVSPVRRGVCIDLP